MVRTLRKRATQLTWAASLTAIFGLSAFAQDPPSRVARLNHIEGSISMEPAGIDDWVPAVVNRPFTTGDYIYADRGSRAELHMDIAVIRAAAQTSFGFLNLDDQGVQIKLAEGDMYLRLHDFSPNQAFEVDTPNAAVTLEENGIYRFHVAPDGAMTFVVIRQGRAQVTGGGQAMTLNAGNSVMLSGTDQLSYDVEVAPVPDDFDSWSAQRDAHEAHLASARYLPPTVIGYEDLDDYGSWQEAADYGPVWYPRAVAIDWAPYHRGTWVWVDPWGWTWVDAAPWGFAPFHYGRWAYISGRWGWCPGPMAVGYRGPVVRPYYAPALVAWFGGSHWGVSVSAGAPSLAWVALGFGEVFTPPYVCTRRYFTNVNVYNTRIVERVNITNVYNTVYVNHAVYDHREFVNVRAPGAVMAVSQSAFANGRPVRESGMTVRQADLSRMRSAAIVAPGVAPTRQSIASTLGRTAPHPSAQVMQRRVIARNTPPPAPAPFAARQQYLRQNAGQLHNYQAMHQAVAPQATSAAFVRQAPAARPVAVHAGERAGNPAAFRARAQAQDQPVVRERRPTPPQQPALTERTQSSPAQPQPRVRERRPTPAPQPAVTEHVRPAPAQSTAAPRVESRPASRPEQYRAPAPPEERRTSPPAHEKNTKDTKDHR